MVKIRSRVKKPRRRLPKGQLFHHNVSLGAIKAKDTVEFRKKYHEVIIFY